MTNSLLGKTLTIDEVNDLPETSFIEIFGDVAENTPWIAQDVARRRPFDSREQLEAAFVDTIRNSPPNYRIGLIRAHPDLAGRAKMAEASVKEQAGAGLDTLTADEFDQFTRLNARYKEKFGFPFIFAVRGATKDMILAAFEERVDNDEDTELRNAMQQIERIFRFRVEDRVSA